MDCIRPNQSIQNNLIQNDDISSSMASDRFADIHHFDSDDLRMQLYQITVLRSKKKEVQHKSPPRNALATQDTRNHSSMFICSSCMQLIFT